MNGLALDAMAVAGGLSSVRIVAVAWASESTLRVALSRPCGRVPEPSVASSGNPLGPTSFLDAAIVLRPVT
jgi:hypothetical protein